MRLKQMSENDPMTRLCPNNGAAMVPDAQHGVWRCPYQACAAEAYKTLDYAPGVTECIALEGREYEMPMSAAEVMRATGAKELC